MAKPAVARWFSDFLTAQSFSGKPREIVNRCHRSVTSLLQATYFFSYLLGKLIHRASFLFTIEYDSDYIPFPFLSVLAFFLGSTPSNLHLRTLACRFIILWQFLKVSQIPSFIQIRIHCKISTVSVQYLELNNNVTWSSVFSVLYTIFLTNFFTLWPEEHGMSPGLDLA